MGVLWRAWSDGVVAHWVELIALEVEAAISSFTDLGPPQTRFTRSCVCPKRRRSGSRSSCRACTARWSRPSSTQAPWPGAVAKFWRLPRVEHAGGIGASGPEVADDPERPR